ncbi:sugar ABC transporter ATP-binding protein [Fontivita pretiosa]|uniref:sugar ABC transporter ATP-binding protein n=1 Tax=Fontivita pretiosa TaxID=2989684 RepID=UPI003D17D607
MMEQPALLVAEGISKSFPGVRALDGVDFVLKAGEIHALMGENGAGKSTLIKVLTGVYRRDAGVIRLNGTPIEPRSPHHAQSLGISTVYQEVNLIPGLSVAENIYLGRQPRRFGQIAWRAMNLRASEAMRRLDIDIDVTRPLDDYPIAIQQMVAIARALDIRASVLILDEPTASLDAAETRQLFSVMRRLAGQGLGIIFVTHFLEQVYQVSGRITVLRNGRLVGTYETAALPRIELIARMMGRQASEVQAMQQERAAPADDTRQPPLLQARGLGRSGSIEPFDLELSGGEVLGLAGLLGSGRSQMVRLLFGIDRADCGTLRIAGSTVNRRRHTPRNAIRLGLGLCPEDRKTSGIIPDLSLRENIILVLQGQRGWIRPLRRWRQQQLAEQFIRALNIATPHAEQPVKFLSGGNQQKAILARWLLSRPKLLLLDEPTRGIDVGAKFEIARLIEQLRREGMAIIFVSAELEEIVRSSQRVAVLRDRRKIAELTGEQINEQRIMATIAGSDAHEPRFKQSAST